LPKALGALIDVENRLRAREKRWRRSLVGRLLRKAGLKTAALKALGLAAVARWLPSHLSIGRLFRGDGLAKCIHALLIPIELAGGRTWRDVRTRHMAIQDVLPLIVLPLEDNPILETDRLQRCPTAHAYYDPAEETVKYIPVCSWRLHNRRILQTLAEHYPYRETVPSDDSATVGRRDRQPVPPGHWARTGPIPQSS
jgi:hypothetical protein